jgi:hypothetical protein
MKGKTTSSRHGKGMKMMLAVVTIEPSAEALHPNAKWLDMRSIKAVFPMKGPTLGSQMILVNVVGPGSVGNYASLTLRHMRNDASVVSLGTPATGTIIMPMLIVGE